MPQPVEVDGILAPTHAPSPSHMDVGCGLARGESASDASSASGRGLTVRSKLPEKSMRSNDAIPSPIAFDRRVGSPYTKSWLEGHPRRLFFQSASYYDMDVG